MLYRAPYINWSIQQQNSKNAFSFLLTQDVHQNPKHCKEKSPRKYNEWLLVYHMISTDLALYFNVLSAFKIKYICFGFICHRIS